MQQSAFKKPLPATNPGSVGNWNASGSWGSGNSGGGGDTCDDDGGWSQGPPASGSGWTARGTCRPLPAEEVEYLKNEAYTWLLLKDPIERNQRGAASNGSAHSLLEWQPSTSETPDWQSLPTSQSIIVDRNDKEAWPSIGGDHSETASENDNVSVKSESVISVGSFGQESTNNSAGSSAIQVPTSSSLWSSTSSFPVSEPSSSWDFGITTPSSAASTAGWSSTNTSLSKNNQGNVMQSMAPGTSDNTHATTSTVTGWGVGTPGTLPQGQIPTQGGNRPQNSVQIQQSLASSIVSNNGNLLLRSVSSNAQLSQTSTGQGNGALHSNSKSPVDSWGSVGSGMVGNDAGKGNSGNNGQPQSIGWGASSTDKNALEKWPPRNPSTGDDWGSSAAPGSQWGTQITTPSRTGATPQWPGATNNSPPCEQNQNPARSQTTWAQAAGKGLNTNPSNTDTSATAASMPTHPPPDDNGEIIASAIECHEGWGKVQIRQDTTWEMDTSPKLRRKGSTATTTATEKPVQPSVGGNGQGNSGSMWNNTNGTAIWESKEPTAPTQWNNSDPNSWAAGAMKPITKDPNSWSSSGQPKENSEPSQWGAKTETGSWANTGESGGMSTWGEGQRRSGEVDDGTAVWGNPTPGVQKPPNWNSAGIPPATPGQVAQRSVQGPKGWGDTQPEGSVNWQAGMAQMANRPGGWGGGDSNQWNATAVSGAKPKPPSTSSWGDEWNPADRKVSTGRVVQGGIPGTDMYWNNPPQQAPPNSAFNWGEKDMIWNTSDYNKDDMVWNEDGSTNWDDTDMGTWSDSTPEINSSWSSATGWKKKDNKNLKGPFTKFPGGFQPPTQMRSRMLQQLMEMGFGKVEAQHALINNNMNIQSALEDLYKMKGANFKRDTDLDVFQTDGAKPKLPGMDIGATDDISDTHPESNPYVPNINSMQNTPFPNAQSQLPNQFIANNIKGPSLTPSSHNNLTNSSIIPPQQRLIQEKFKHQQNSMSAPPPGPPPPGQVIGGRAMPTPGHQQQMAQQQILQQLHLAVKAGLINPTLLNQQLPPPMLVMLQQLLQHQQLLQSFITTQQVIQQNKKALNPMMQRQQLEQVNMKVNSVKNQILLLQRQITEAQKALIKPQNLPQQQTEVEQTPSTPDIQNLAISQPQPPQSKLSQWKKGSDSAITPTSAEPGATDSALNKAVGSKPAINQSSNNLRYGELGLSNNPFVDHTWTNMSSTSSTTSTSWPSAIGTTSNIVTSSSDEKPTKSEGKESQPTSSSSITINDSIPEFVPGKPWLGITKSVEDDPHITPGSFSRSLSLSVNTVKDDYLSSLTKTSPNVTESPSWNSKVAQNSKWSTNDSVPTSFSNEVWGVPYPKNNSRPPPGLHKSSGNWSGVNRQHSWAGPSNPSIISGSTTFSSDGRIYPCLILKNLTPQIDGSTLKTLCMQHGPLQWFYLSLHNGQALVRYHSKEEAFKAQKSLNTCVLGNTTIVAEFVTDSEAQRFVEQSAMAAQPSQWSQQHNNPSLYRQPSNNRPNSDMGWNSATVTTAASSSMWGQGGGLLGGDDHNASALLGNMLGETM